MRGLDHGDGGRVMLREECVNGVEEAMLARQAKQSPKADDDDAFIGAMVGHA